MGCDYCLAPRLPVHEFPLWLTPNKQWLCSVIGQVHIPSLGAARSLIRCSQSGCAESHSHKQMVPMATHFYLGFLVHLRLSNISFLCNLRFLVYKCLCVSFAHFSIGLLIFSMSDWRSSFILWILTLCWLQMLQILSVCDLSLLSSLCLLIMIHNET